MTTLTLKLGVIDLPYTVAYDPTIRGSISGMKRRFHPRYNQNMTTGDVAEVLEAKYGIMRYFADKNMEFIISSITKSLLGEYRNIRAGKPPTPGGFSAQGSSVVEQRFKQALANKEFDGLPGVPTKASLLGISHRFKNPYAKRSSRPSFIDTGMYQSSFKAWMS